MNLSQLVITACCRDLSKICFAQREREGAPKTFILMLSFPVPDVKAIALYLNDQHFVGVRLIRFKMI